MANNPQFTTSQSTTHIAWMTWACWSVYTGTVILGSLTIANNKIQTMDDSYQNLSVALQHIDRSRLICVDDCELVVPDRDIAMKKLIKKCVLPFIIEPLCIICWSTRGVGDYLWFAVLSSYYDLLLEHWLFFMEAKYVRLNYVMAYKGMI